MRWIDRVEFLAEDQTNETTQELPPGLSHLSRWICSTAGFEVYKTMRWLIRSKSVGLARVSMPVKLHVRVVVLNSLENL
jgi:hypothetical protein